MYKIKEQKRTKDVERDGGKERESWFVSLPHKDGVMSMYLRSVLFICFGAFDWKKHFIFVWYPSL